VTAAASPAESAPLLVGERTVALDVPNLEAAVEGVTAAAKRAGGALKSRNEALLSIAVPQDRAAEFVQSLKQLGDLTQQASQSHDVGFKAADLEAAARAARARRSELEQLRARTRQVDEVLQVEHRIAEVNAALADAERELRALRLAVTRVIFRVVLRPTPIETLPAPTLPFPWLDTLSGGELLNPSSVPAGEVSQSFSSNAELAFGLEVRRLVDRPTQGEASHAVLPALTMRGAETDPVGFAGGFDAKLGGVVDGFVYELRGLAGLGTAIGSVVTLGLMGGVGFSGWTGDRVPSSLELPLELFAFFDLGKAFRLTLFAQPRWAVTREARQGARHGQVADEYTTGGAVLLPFVLGEDDLEDGGLRLGFEYGEVLQTRTYAVTAGVGFGFPSY
jgi:hypothetical protein